MARDAAGWEWGHAKQVRAQLRRDRKHRAAERRAAVERRKVERAMQREAREAQIQERITRDIEAMWTMGGKDGPTFYVYVLERLPVDPFDKVKYVGVTDDPKRRYLEHRRCGRLGDTDFRMVIVGEVRFSVAEYLHSYKHRPSAGVYYGYQVNMRQVRMRQVRQAEKTIAERYRAKGFELVNAD